MKFIRFTGRDGKIYYGCDYRDKTAALVKGNIFEDFKITDKRVIVEELVSPVSPCAVLCIGLNYRMHAEETGIAIPKYPILFMKNPGAVTGPYSDIEIPVSCLNPPEVDYEAELAVVIGKSAKNVTPETAVDHIAGYTCANDVSARRWQKHAGGGQWVRGKSFDTFCPMGPVLVTTDEIKDPQALTLECRLNGRTMQKGSTSDMIFSVGEIISFLSQSTTLAPGTVILTGTPSGVGFTRKPPVYLKPGDVLETEIKDIGALKNKITAEPGNPVS